MIIDVTDSGLINGKVGLKVGTARAIFDDVRITGPDGAVWKYDDFQAKGDLTSTVTLDKVSGLPSGEKYTYDSHNRPITVIDKNKKRTSVTRDEHGNITMVADAAGNVTMRSYDAFGNLLTETAPINPTNNFLPNPSCDAAKADWDFTSRDASTTSYDATTGYDGSSSIKLVYDGSTN